MHQTAADPWTNPATLSTPAGTKCPSTYWTARAAAAAAAQTLRWTLTTTTTTSQTTRTTRTTRWTWNCPQTPRRCVLPTPGHHKAPFRQQRLPPKQTHKHSPPCTHASQLVHPVSQQARLIDWFFRLHHPPHAASVSSCCGGCGGGGGDAAPHCRPPPAAAPPCMHSAAARAGHPGSAAGGQAPADGGGVRPRGSGGGVVRVVGAPRHVPAAAFGRRRRQ